MKLVQYDCRSIYCPLILLKAAHKTMNIKLLFSFYLIILFHQNLICRYDRIGRGLQTTKHFDEDKLNYVCLFDCNETKGVSKLHRIFILPVKNVCIGNSFSSVCTFNVHFSSSTNKRFHRTTV